MLSVEKKIRKNITLRGKRGKGKRKRKKGK
jgi:hypothetical protein